MSRHAHRFPFGASTHERGTRFRVWAPGCGQLSLRLEDDVDTPMRPADDGWFELDAGCGAGTRYRYLTGDGRALADPASRAQPEGVGGPSLVVDPLAWTWRHDDWRGRPWHEAVVYELHPGACGGFAGIEQRLPALAALGITAIQMMPIAQFPGDRNWGYDGVLPFAPAAAYGTPDQLKSMIDAAHGLGLMVMLDVVYNHFGPDGNVMPALAPEFFRDDLDTPWGPAIDFRRRQVRDFFIHNALYWLMEYRFDGLRLDAVHAISERDWLVELADTVAATIEPGRHVHLVLENENNDAGLLREGYTAQWNDDAHHVLHVLLTGEADAYYADYAADPTAGLARWLGEGFVFQGQPCGHRDGAPRGQPSGDLPPTAFINCMQNHDQVGNRALGDRLTTLADPQALQVANALLLLTPQVPMLFMGEEWNSTRPFLYFTDHHGELADAVREGRRREFAGFPAFRDPATRDAIPDPNARGTFDASIPESEPADAQAAAHHDRMASLLRIRRQQLAPRLAGARSLGARVLAHAAVEARWAMADGSVLVLLVNLGNEAVRGLSVAGELLHDTAAGNCASGFDGELRPLQLVALLQAGGSQSHG